jgi:NAD(P)H-hydrate epimerase
MERYSPHEKTVVMTREQVRAVDAWAINELGIPGVVLMENAGRACAELVKDKLENTDEPKVCIFCGTGNNGGDGYVIARHLVNVGYIVTVVVCGDRGRIRGDAKINLDILDRMGLSIDLLNPADDNVAARVAEFTAGADMIVDSLFGTGLSGQIRDDYRSLIDGINAGDCPVLAVDIPSGLDCDTGQPLGAAVRASWTVTFVAVKQGFTCAKAARYTGEVFVASIGVAPA